MKLAFWIVLPLVTTACVAPLHRHALASPCERNAPLETAEPLFAMARELLVDTSSASIRAQFNLDTSPNAVTWVGEPGTCRRLADAIAKSSGRPADYNQAIAAVTIGRFYLVRLGPGRQWLIGPDFRVRSVFVGT